MPKGPQGWPLAWRVLFVFAGVILVWAAVLVTWLVPAPFRMPVLLALLAGWLARRAYGLVWLWQMKRSGNV